MGENAAVARHTAAEVGGLGVLLFGMPAAGKSSLLGALAQAAQTQAGLLGGHLKDESGGLAELQRRVYRDQAQETLEEVVPYPVTFNPAGKNTPPFQATLIDCDGRVAHSYLTGQRDLGAVKGQLELGKAIQKADALLLVVDVSAEPDQLRRDFAQFTQFLRTLEKYRGQAAEVAGLPVYLVLTKCDLLVKAKDTTSQWIQRIEEGKRKIGQRFKDFLASEAQREQRPFGRIDLHVWATAVKRPELADKPERPGEPFGVAELFRQCLAAGQAFQMERGRAERRLQYVFAGIVGLLAILLMAGAFFFLSREPDGPTVLETRARALLPTEKDRGTFADRLKEPADEAVKKLDHIINDPDFDKLPQLLRLEVQTRHDALKRYAARVAVFDAAKRGPEEFGKEEVFTNFEKFLEEFLVPAEYARTPLDKDVQATRKQVGQFREKVNEVDRWFEDQIPKRTQAADKLLQELRDEVKDSLKKFKDWAPRAEAFLKKHPEGIADLRPYPPERSVEGFPKVSYGQLYQWHGPQDLLTQWADRRAKLTKAVAGG